MSQLTIEDLKNHVEKLMGPLVDSSGTIRVRSEGSDDAIDIPAILMWVALRSFGSGVQAQSCQSLINAFRTSEELSVASALTLLLADLKNGSEGGEVKDLDRVGDRPSHKEVIQDLERFMSEYDEDFKRLAG